MQISNLDSDKSKYANKLRTRGFTLIELLVVIAIIGILAALSLVSFTTSQRQARDAQRKSDLKQYSTSLESFANTTGGLYPSYYSGLTNPVQILDTTSNSVCTSLGLSNCPIDPNGTGTHIYKYLSNGKAAGSTASQYVLWVGLEGSTNWFIVCSNGKTGTYPGTWGGSTYDPATNKVDCPI